MRKCGGHDGVSKIAPHRLRGAAAGLLWLVGAAPAAAREGGHRYLAHHWQSPEYRAEIRCQLIWICGCLLAAGVWALVQRLRSTRRCGS